MAFTALLTRLREGCREVGGANGAAALALLENPAVLEALRNTYKAHPAVKLFWRTAADRAIRHVRSWTPPPGAGAGADLAGPAAAPAGEIERLLLHVAAQVAPHTSSPNLDVRRYATACVALGGEETRRMAASLLAAAVEGNELAAGAVSASLHWTLAHCLKCGAPVVPFG